MIHDYDDFQPKSSELESLIPSFWLKEEKSTHSSQIFPFIFSPRPWSSSSSPHDGIEMKKLELAWYDRRDDLYLPEHGMSIE